MASGPTTFVAAVVKLALLAALVASCGASPSDTGRPGHQGESREDSSLLHP